MLKLNSEEKSFHQRLKEQRGEIMDSCPYCGNTTQVYETPEGVIDCYRCGVNQTRTQTILRGEGKDREPITIKAEDPTLTQQVQDSFREDQRKGEKGGGSNNGKTRKKPIKRIQSRVEQEPVFFNGSSGGSIIVKTKRIENLSEELKIRITPDLKSRLQEYADSLYLNLGDVSAGRLVRDAITKNAARMESSELMPDKRGLDREILKVRVTPSQKQVVEGASKYNETSENIIVISCLKKFLENFS